MDNPNPDALEERAMAETPEDVAVLYSWANLQGAKYRDFSASRREYRAQMRHRAAEQQREEEMRAKAEAEAVASAAEHEAREAEEAARFHESAAKKASDQRHRQEMEMEEAARERAMQHAAELNRRAASERVEAARRAEAVAAAEAAARREAREMAEAQASAARQAARYAESEYVRRSLAGPQPSAIVPGQISDPYTNEEPLALPGRLFHQPHVHVQEDDMQPTRLPRSREPRLLVPQPDPRDPGKLKPGEEFWVTGPIEEEAKIAAAGTAAIEEAATRPKTSHVSYYYEPDSQEKVAAVEHYAQSAPYTAPAKQYEAISPYSDPAPPQPRVASYESTRETTLREPAAREQASAPRRSSSSSSIYDLGSAAPLARAVAQDSVPASARESGNDPVPARGQQRNQLRSEQLRIEQQQRNESQRSGVYEASKAAEPSPRSANQPRRSRGYRPDEASGPHQSYSASPFVAETPAEPEGALPAWINAHPEPQHSPEQHMTEFIRPADFLRGGEEQRSQPQPPPAVRKLPAVIPAASPVADTLQHSRERVAARWYALKGIFDQSVQEPQLDVAPVRHADIRVPMLTVFSLAGGVGKTSLVATLGRALSSTGEKVLLTDTTSHGLLPFYFGASELRPGVVRTFSPPAGSSDAPIALVSYDVAQHGGDAAGQEWLADELTRNSRGIQRVVLDLSPSSAWVVRKLARMNSVIVVPVAPDMNSVISLGPVEKFFAGMIDGDGRPVQPFYLLNQFDASLPLHLDVREVMRQQLGDRLLPFIIRRSPVVSEALAEGMTVMDYAPDAPVASDYMNFASWLRMQSAPAASGFKNARWSER